ncbi:30340_t:CDS:2, partial [Gigaspora margarita]
NPYRPRISPVHIPQNQKLLPKQNFNYSVTASDKVLPKNTNDRLPGKTVKQWGSRLRKRYKELTYKNYEQPLTLRACQVLHDTLLQIDEEANNNIETDQTNEEFKRLSIITGDYEKSIIFREQNMGPVLKRRAVAMHNAKVSKFHPDNKLLEKEFDKRRQFKFALCSLTKFFIDNKPNNKDKKKNTRTDWLKNKQIIVYNRSEIDDYLSNAFKQILYQVEERGEELQDLIYGTIRKGDMTIDELYRKLLRIGRRANYRPEELRRKFLDALPLSWLEKAENIGEHLPLDELAKKLYEIELHQIARPKRDRIPDPLVS